MKGSHYQVACGKYFEATHGKQSSGIQHPNQYFEESQVALGNRPGIKQERKDILTHGSLERSKRAI